MEYETKMQLDRIETKLDEILTELGIIDNETGKYVKYEDRHETNGKEDREEEEDEEEITPMMKRNKTTIG